MWPLVRLLSKVQTTDALSGPLTPNDVGCCMCCKGLRVLNAAPRECLDSAAYPTVGMHASCNQAHSTTMNADPTSVRGGVFNRSIISRRRAILLENGRAVESGPDRFLGGVRFGHAGGRLFVGLAQAGLGAAQHAFDIALVPHDDDYGQRRRQRQQGPALT